MSSVTKYLSSIRKLPMKSRLLVTGLHWTLFEFYKNVHSALRLIDLPCRQGILYFLRVSEKLIHSSNFVFSSEVASSIFFSFKSSRISCQNHIFSSSRFTIRSISKLIYFLAREININSYPIHYLSPNNLRCPNFILT